MNTERSDNELIERCRRGDHSAFNVLVERYYRIVFNVAYRMTRVKEDSEDVTQCVFIKAYEKLDSFKPRYKFFSWIYRIAVNESINHLNQLKHTDELNHRLKSEENSPEREIETSELGNQIQESLMSLQPEQRALIVLKHFQNCSYEDISYILNIPENRVKSRLYSARQLLKTMLMQKGIVKNG